jgi:uncharacterized protein (TIGR02452 family)
LDSVRSQIPRVIASRLGREALRIGKSGVYRAPSGQTVDIQDPIQRAVRGTVSYPPDAVLEEVIVNQHDTVIEVTNETTLSAASCLKDGGYDTVILNFASATSPGGGFLSGARAQEEYLARSTCLYACIQNSPMYAFHRWQHDYLYSDYAIYSPDVPVIRGEDSELLEEPWYIGIITSAAVYAKRLPPERRGEIRSAMWQRILRVLRIGALKGHDAIVLGAWGCGAFGNDGWNIARLFQKALSEDYCGVYQRVIFAIVDWSDNQRFIGPFSNTFGNSCHDG